MHAIVNISGFQYKVKPNDSLLVSRLDTEVDNTVEFNEILLYEEDGSTIIGKPYVEGISVVAKIMEHTRGNKVIVFKKKRRKGYKKLTGHRQHYTRLMIEGIYKNETDVTMAKKNITKPENLPEEKIDVSEKVSPDRETSSLTKTDGGIKPQSIKKLRNPRQTGSGAFSEEIKT